MKTEKSIFDGKIYKDAISNNKSRQMIAMINHFDLKSLRIIFSQ